MRSFQRMSKGGSKKVNKVSSSAGETQRFGACLASELIPGSLVCLFGGLGTGKTTLIKGVARRLVGIDPRQVVSPTFTYLSSYRGKIVLHHFDLYRLRDHEDFLERGFDEYFDCEGVCCVEWAEKIEPILPANALKVRIKHLGQNRRELSVEYEESPI